MLFPMLAVALSFCGIAVLGVLAALVLAQVRRLARQVEESSRRIARATEDLERAAAPLAAEAARVAHGVRPE
ncbi:hypothetical protein J7W19_05870 [Streptomyces mobaraensis NBRC 13819 = DSM 40847]|uniref:DUF948 domain-containing protein n=2 Tax=Streptomyces mobaraensis TaxID=35621 RepID=A0A5N5VZR4_STRMB|nr:hypothetical protein [Streptomyces mobaraensis]EMF00086.1 hypothetical protein H340_12967 [Streptomyces mobaraensis NBRC 13819 = DSM 40847]KAB7834480.1 hypothetical protein FRZ00_29490 [Streptomyces mobaraensis]QTT73013.1 hypothetical protein J7W19_05870 [Streptomyces mobaraensis NBRC 13819 = DSM 40847]